MKKLLIATCGIMLTLGFTTNPKTETALAAKACDFCSYIECGKSYIEIQENGWWLPKICHNYVAIGYEGCSMHGGRSCDAAEN